MTDTKELIARLRKSAHLFTSSPIARDCSEAADLLERQSEALRLIADIPDPGAEKERSATFYRVHAAMLKQAAAKALGRETVSPEALAWADEWLKSEEGRQATQYQEQA